VIRMDRYVRDHWHRVPAETRAAIEVRIPAGHTLSVTHGGSRYSAFLYDADGTLVAENRQQARIGSACLGLLHTYPVAA
jgi:YD repeat-containing protein